MRYAQLPSFSARPSGVTEDELLLYFKRVVALQLASDIDVVADAIVSAATTSTRHVGRLVDIFADLQDADSAGPANITRDTVLLTIAKLSSGTGVSALSEATNAISSAGARPANTAALLDEATLLFSSLIRELSAVLSANNAASALIEDAQIPKIFVEASLAEIRRLVNAPGDYDSDIRYEIAGNLAASEAFSAMPDIVTGAKTHTASITTAPVPISYPLAPYLPCFVETQLTLDVNGTEVISSTSTRATFSFDAAPLRRHVTLAYCGVSPIDVELRANSDAVQFFHSDKETLVTEENPAVEGENIYVSYSYSILTDDALSLTVRYDNTDVTYDLSDTGYSLFELSSPANLTAALVELGLAAEYDGSVITVTADWEVAYARIETGVLKAINNGFFGATWSETPETFNEVLNGSLTTLNATLAVKQTVADLVLPDSLAVNTTFAITGTVSCADKLHPAVVQTSVALPVGCTIRINKPDGEFLFRVISVDGLTATLDSDVVFFSDAKTETFLAVFENTQLVITTDADVNISGPINQNVSPDYSYLTCVLSNLQVIRPGDTVTFADGQTTAILNNAGHLVVGGLQVRNAEPATISSAALKNTRSGLPAIRAFMDSYSKLDETTLRNILYAYSLKDPNAVRAVRFLEALSELHGALSALSELHFVTKFAQLIRAAKENKLDKIARMLATADFKAIRNLSINDLGATSFPVI